MNLAFIPLFENVILFLGMRVVFQKAIVLEDQITINVRKVSDKKTGDSIFFSYISIIDER